jgi:hypothetical protein
MDRIFHDFCQVLIKQRLATIQSNSANAGTLAIFEQPLDQRKGELGAGHEIASILTADAAEVTVSGQSDVDFLRIRLNNLREYGRSRVSGNIDIGIQRFADVLEVRILSQHREGQLNELRSEGRHGYLSGGRDCELVARGSSSAVRPSRIERAKPRSAELYSTTNPGG